MNILVTGGAGYIGSACIKKLRELGHEIIVVDNLYNGRRELLPEDVKFYQLDLAKDDLAPIFNENEIDKILHLAAYKDAGESMINLPKYGDNITGTLRLLNEVSKHKVKQIIYSSSALCYGEVKYSPLDEIHSTKPVNYYGFTKLKCEEIIEWYAKQYKFSSISLRYFNPIGDGGLNYIDPNVKNLTPLLMEVAAGKREKLLVYGNDYDTKDGTCIRDYVDLNDLVDAHVKALELNTIDVINLGTAVGRSVMEMIEIVQKVTGKEIKYEITQRREGDPAALVTSYDKAKEILGWEPKTSIEDSVLSMWKVYNKPS